MNTKAWAMAAIMAFGIGATANDASAAEHKVQSGESLSVIAERYNVSVSQLKAANGLSSNVIYAGQTLQVGGTSSTKASASSGSKVHYTIQYGDTLAEIAAAYGTTAQTLANWNGLSSVDMIHVGDVLVVKNGSGRASAQSSKRNVQSQQSTQQSSNVSQTMTVVATAYTAYCTGCSGITANGTDIRSNPHLKVIAVDPRVIPLGTRVWVEGYGEAIAADTGGAIKGNRIDVFIPSHSDAMDWGRRTVTLKILN